MRSLAETPLLPTQDNISELIVDENLSVRFFLTHFLISWCLLWEVWMVISVVLNFEDIMKCGQVFNLCMNLCRNVCLWARIEHLIIYSHDDSWLNCIIVPEILSATLVYFHSVFRRLWKDLILRKKGLVQLVETRGICSFSVWEYCHYFTKML